MNDLTGTTTSAARMHQTALQLIDAKTLWKQCGKSLRHLYVEVRERLIMPSLACLRQNSRFLLPPVPKFALVVHPGWPHFLLWTSIMPSFACLEQNSLLAAGNAEGRQRGAPWVAAPLADDVDHAILGVLGAEPRRLPAGHAEVRGRGAPWVAAPRDDVDHAILGVLGAELRLPAACHAEPRSYGAAVMVTAALLSPLALGNRTRCLLRKAHNRAARKSSKVSFLVCVNSMRQTQPKQQRILLPPPNAREQGPSV